MAAPAGQEVLQQLQLVGVVQNQQPGLFGGVQPAPDGSNGLFLVGLVPFRQVQHAGQGRETG
jgi:hypothetical protein